VGHRHFKSEENFGELILPKTQFEPGHFLQHLSFFPSFHHLAPFLLFLIFSISSLLFILPL
jgi:hypothetical protein